MNSDAVSLAKPSLKRSGDRDDGKSRIDIVKHFVAHGPLIFHCAIGVLHGRVSFISKGKDARVIPRDDLRQPVVLYRRVKEYVSAETRNIPLKVFGG